jgi:hypothetical protein
LLDLARKALEGSIIKGAGRGAGFAIDKLPIPNSVSLIIVWKEV